MRRRGLPSSVGDDMLVPVQCNIQGSTLRSFFACINYVHKKERGRERENWSEWEAEGSRAGAGGAGWAEQSGKGEGKGTLHSLAAALLAFFPSQHE